MPASLRGDSPRDNRPVGQARMRTHSPRAHAYKRPTSQPYPDAIGRSLSHAAEVRITESVNQNEKSIPEVRVYTRMKEHAYSNAKCIPK